MEKHILNLLNTNLRVIIPDFGAFIIRQKEPLVLVFNEFLRYNDGLLIDYIAKIENIDKDMAKHQVTEYTENLIKGLEAGKEVRLEGIGTLHKAGADKIEFVQVGKEMPKKSTKKVQEKKPDEAPLEAAKPTDVVPEVSKTVAKPVSRDKSEISMGTEVKEEKPESKTPEEKLTSNGSVKKPVSQTKTDAGPKPVEKPLQKPSAARPLVAKPPIKVELKKKNNKQQIIWIILIVLVVALINIWFIFNNQIKSFFNEHRLTKPVADTLGKLVGADIVTDTISADSTVEFREARDEDSYAAEKAVEKTPAVEITKPAKPGEKKYYIVAGCFRDEINADAMVKELNQKGYKAQKFGTIGNLHAVSYSSFTDKEKAAQEMERIRKEVAPEAWMVYY